MSPPSMAPFSLFTLAVRLAWEEGAGTGIAFRLASVTSTDPLASLSGGVGGVVVPGMAVQHNAVGGKGPHFVRAFGCG